MANRIILHVGTHKTGTTSLQHFCRKNEKLLEQQNFYYPDYDIIGLKKAIAHHELSHAIAGKSEILTDRDVRRFIRSIKKINGTVLISAEPFYRHFDDKTEGSIWEKKNRYIKKVASLFGKETEICLVFRNQYNFAKSLYQEIIKTDNLTSNFEEFLDSRADWFDYFKNYQLWKNHFNAIHTLSFEKLVKSNGVERSFLEYFNLNSEGLLTVQKQNDSLPFDLIEVKRNINRLNLERNTLLRIRNLMAESIKDPNSLNIDLEKYEWIENSSINDFISKFDEGNRSLAKINPDLLTITELRKETSKIYPGLDSSKLLALLKYYFNIV